MLNVHGHFVVSDCVIAEVPTGRGSPDEDQGLDTDPDEPRG
jgi:hypothetical protein